MPKRTTPFQMVVHFVRKHFAKPDVTVTESKELRDARLGIGREVDVVVEGHFDGDEIVTSVEVIEHARPATITWVEQQITKHRHLPTNRLVLVSKSGFSKNALTAVASEGGWVEAVRPEVVEVDGQPLVKRLFVDQIQLTPTICRLHVRKPDGTEIVVRAFPDNVIFASDGAELGNAIELSTEALNLDWLRTRFTKEAHEHPERAELKGFACGLDVRALGYYLRDEATGDLHLVETLELLGDFAFVQEELALVITDLAGRRYGTGEAVLLGRPTVWVGTTDDALVTTLSWRTKDDKPLFGPVPARSPRFAALATLTPTDV